MNRPETDIAFRSGIPQLKGIVARNPQPTLVAQIWEDDMTEIPYKWRAYLALQAELGQRGDVSSVTLGIEAGLNHLLEDPCPTPDSVRRAIAAGSRRNRYADGLLAKYVSSSGYRLDGVTAIEARSNLEKIRSGLSSATVAILLEAACGEDSTHMAAKRGTTITAIQTRLSRARSSARRLAA